MTFAASKTRQRITKPIAQGKMLVANAGIEAAYAQQIQVLINRMTNDYRTALTAGYDHEDVEEFYSSDASPTTILKRILGKLDRKWRGLFTDFAKKHAKDFATKVDNYSQFTSRHSLKSLGLDNPQDAQTEQMAQTLQSSIAENVSLITNIQEEFAKNIEGAVFRSISSPNPDENVTKLLMDTLTERDGMSKRRAQFIAEDQNSKLYSALNTERMRQNGVEKFKWKHSSAGKYPRETHIARGKANIGYGPGIYRIDSPELWEGPKADQGLPGQAIRCRCRMIPILDTTPENSND